MTPLPVADFQCSVCRPMPFYFHLYPLFPVVFLYRSSFVCEGFGMTRGTVRSTLSVNVIHQEKSPSAGYTITKNTAISTMIEML
jgi:hypothetical protein